MGLLDSIVGSLAGGDQGQNQLLQLVTGLITQHGGIEGVLQKFAAHGMGEQAKQWVGTGPNPPITGDHVQQVFGNDTVQQVASQLGVPPPQAASGLAALLPTVIDKLTPNGQKRERPGFAEQHCRAAQRRHWRARPGRSGQAFRQVIVSR